MTEGASQVGQYLQYERQKRDISLEEIADQLKLSLATLEDLETASYDKLPSPAYIRGYIRAYCAAIEIDPAPALQLFSEQSGQANSFIPKSQDVTPLVNEKIQRTTRIWGTVLVVTVIIFALASRWSEKSVEPQLQGQAVTQQQETIPKSPTQVSEGVIDLDAVDRSDVVGSQEDPEPAAEDSPFAAWQESADDDPEPAETLTMTGETVNMTVRTEGSSWVRIYTAEEDIIRRLLPIDYDKSFQIALPVHIELGDARHVQLWFNGKRYDFSSYISDIHTAFFSLEELPDSE